MADIQKIQTGSGAEVGRTRTVNRSGFEPNGDAFAALLQNELQRDNGIKFSAHAQSRLRERSIEFGENEAMRLKVAVDKASQKGSRESLVLLDNLALLVNIPKQTVITAVDSRQSRDNIWTNIDSVVMG